MASLVVFGRSMSVSSISISSHSTPSSSSDECVQFVVQLPRLNKADLITCDTCPICLLPLDDFLSGTVVLADEKTDPAEESDDDLTGVTKLEGCGHVFCRRDLAEWILSGHGSCPLCRHVFLEIETLSEPETSDGGEYIPSSDFVDDDMEDYEADENGSDWPAEDTGGWTDEDDLSNAGSDADADVEEEAEPEEGPVAAASSESSGDENFVRARTLPHSPYTFIYSPVHFPGRSGER